MGWALEKDEVGEAKTSGVCAISGGPPARRKGLSCPILRSLPRARACSNIGRVIPVSIRPGQTALTRTPVPASWLAAVCTRLMTPALLALYGRPPAPERSPATLAVQMV